VDPKAGRLLNGNAYIAYRKGYRLSYCLNMNTGKIIWQHQEVRTHSSQPLPQAAAENLPRHAGAGLRLRRIFHDPAPPPDGRDIVVAGAREVS
jgi:hypothetical protein